MATKYSKNDIRRINAKSIEISRKNDFLNPFQRCRICFGSRGYILKSTNRKERKGVAKSAVIFYRVVELLEIGDWLLEICALH
jgi:hypothetical protein